jgi:cardiolipin synthase
LVRGCVSTWADQPYSSTPSSKPTKQTSIPPPITPKLLARPHEYIWTIPNILTFSRLASAPLIGYFILTSQPIYALSLFAYAAVTDGLDGYIARHFNQQTVVGTVIDPMADKALMTISVIALAIQNIIPPWLAVIILGRDVALSFTAFYYRWISLPPPKTMARYWDFSLPSAEVRPTEISKWNTFLQLLLVGAGMTMPVLPEAVIAAWHLNQGFEMFQYLVAGTTVWSGASYLYSKDAVKILTREEIDQRMKDKADKERQEKADAQK